MDAGVPEQSEAAIKCLDRGRMGAGEALGRGASGSFGRSGGVGSLESEALRSLHLHHSAAMDGDLDHPKPQTGHVAPHDLNPVRVGGGGGGWIGVRG